MGRGASSCPLPLARRALLGAASACVSPRPADPVSFARRPYSTANSSTSSLLSNTTSGGTINHRDRGHDLGTKEVSFGMSAGSTSASLSLALGSAQVPKPAQRADGTTGVLQSRSPTTPRPRSSSPWSACPLAARATSRTSCSATSSCVLFRPSRPLLSACTDSLHTLQWLEYQVRPLGILSL